MHTKLVELVGEIDDARQSLTASVASLSQKQIDWRPNNESWSIGEVLDHLVLVETGISKLLHVKAREAQSGDTSPTEGSALASLDRFPVGNRRRRMSAPAIVTPRCGKQKDELTANLSSSRAKLMNSIALLANHDLHQLRHTHPTLGELDLYQWILFIGKHERRHLQQVQEILSSIDFPKEDGS